MKIGQTIAIAALIGVLAGAGQAAAMEQTPMQNKPMASESRAPMATGRSAHRNHHPAVVIHRHHRPHPLMRHQHFHPHHPHHPH
jgi:hypothetical protein